MPRTSCPCAELLTPVLPSARFLGAGGTAGPRGLADASVLCLQGNPAAEEVTAQKRHPAGGRAVQRGEAEDISFWGSGCQVFPERCRPWGWGPSPVSAHGGRCRMHAGSLLRSPVLMWSWGPAVSLVPGVRRFPGFCGFLASVRGAVRPGLWRMHGGRDGECVTAAVVYWECPRPSPFTPGLQLREAGYRGPRAC